MVIKMVPAVMRGELVMTSRSRKPWRAPASRAMNRSTTMLRMAAMTGEKNRTPNCVSPQSAVPANWMKAMPGGLLK